MQGEKNPYLFPERKLRLREDTKLAEAEMGNHTSRQPSLNVITPGRMRSRRFWEVNLTVEMIPSCPFKLELLWWTVLTNPFRFTGFFYIRFAIDFISAWTFESINIPKSMSLVLWNIGVPLKNSSLHETYTLLREKCHTQNGNNKGPYAMDEIYHFLLPHCCKCCLYLCWWIKPPGFVAYYDKDYYQSQKRKPTWNLESSSH